MSTFTITASRTNTFTQARVRHVMASVFEDFIAMTFSTVLELERVQGWEADLTHVMILEALESFQIQFTKPDGTKVGVGYRVSDDGSVSENAPAGGINYYLLPKGTHVALVLHLRGHAPKRKEALAYLRRRDWAFNGRLMEAGRHDRAYSSEGYGLVRERLGTW
jgi:hypothetical protein